jgi:uncharacterized protein YqhQ
LPWGRPRGFILFSPCSLYLCGLQNGKDAMAEYNYGGQAVIEGVMMRGARRMAIAVRAPDGEIIAHSEPLDERIYAGPFSKWPFVRGLTMLWDALVLGIRSLIFSADVAAREFQPRDETGGAEERIEPGRYFSGPLAWGTMAVALAAAVGFFFVAPLLLVSLVDRFIASALLSNLLEGLIRLAFFLLYVYLIGFIPDIRRVFAYHGAEHKTINAYEQGAELTPQGIKPYSVLHPRCGTAFLLVVMVVAILIFTFLGRPVLWLRIASRVLLIPLIAGIAYELIRFGARHRSNSLIHLAVAPGLALQRLTTREPDEAMLEVALFAFKRLLAEDEVVLDDAAAIETTGLQERAEAL